MFVTDASYKGATALLGYLFIEEVLNPVDGWSTPVFTIGCNYSDSYYLDRDHLSTNNYTIAAKYSGSTLALYLTCPYANSNCIPDNTSLSATDDASAGFPFIPISIACRTLGKRHWHMGDVCDMWWGHYSIPTGDTYPDTPSGSLRQFIQIHKAILPWDGLVLADGTAINMS